MAAHMLPPPPGGLHHHHQNNHNSDDADSNGGNGSLADSNPAVAAANELPDTPEAWDDDTAKKALRIYFALLDDIIHESREVRNKRKAHRTVADLMGRYMATKNIKSLKLGKHRKLDARTKLKCPALSAKRVLKLLQDVREVPETVREAINKEYERARTAGTVATTELVPIELGQKETRMR